MSLTYRHRVTGLVSEFPEALAAVHADVLELVDEDAKPLAYTPASPEEVEAAIAAVADPVDIPAAPESAPAEPAPIPTAPKPRKGV